MAKRKLESVAVIKFFTIQPLEVAEQFLGVAKEIVRDRTAKERPTTPKAATRTPRKVKVNGSSGLVIGSLPVQDSIGE